MKKIPIPMSLQKKTLCDSSQYEALYKQSVDDPEGFWNEQAEQLAWFKKWDRTFHFDFHKAEVKWFTGGKINVCYNCLDRHIESKGDKTAIIWEDDSGKLTKKYSYKEVLIEVSKIANILKRNGLKKGDRVAIYMGMIPELAFATLACARIGVVHSIIFGGFSYEAINTRVKDSDCKMVITASHSKRAGKTINLKAIVDKGLEGIDFIEKVLVVKHGENVPMQKGRDVWLHEELELVGVECEAELLDSEDPLFILYTSGSTGKPKGVVHTQAGYILYTSLTHKYVFDLREDDIYFCAADLGWITGHSYIIYGPLANGTTTVMFESTPTYPHAGRYWEMVEKYKITSLYTAPTAIRALLKEGDEHVKKFDRSSLRILGTVGEPINYDAWMWYYQVVGNENCAIVDTWWQTETGGVMIAPLPGAIEAKPGSAAKPFFGIQPCLVDAEGRELAGDSEVTGNLCIKHSWPSQMRTVYGDHERFKETYFTKFPGMFYTGDGAKRDADGYYWIIGRNDDVLNVAGHRLGTSEVESSVIKSAKVVECAVVGKAHEVKGESIFVFAILRPNLSESHEEIKQHIRRHVKDTLSPIAMPDGILFVSDLPKTRSGKIMRRILRKIAGGEQKDFGDITTLADPAVA